MGKYLFALGKIILGVGTIRGGFFGAIFSTVMFIWAIVDIVSFLN